MPTESVHHAIVAIVVVATLVPSFALAYTPVRFRVLLAYAAGLVCGIVVLVAEGYLANGIFWIELICVLLLPLVGMVAAAGWRSRKPSRLIASLVLVAGALYVVVISILSMPARVDVPFAAATKGSAVEAEFKVATTMTYNFELNLYARKGDREDSDRVSKLVGTGAHRDGRQVDTGLAIPVRLRVERRDESGVSSILDNVFTDHDLQGHAADHFSKRITRIRLKPGRYRARIEAVDNVPQLEGIHVLFGIRVPGH